MIPHRISAQINPFVESAQLVCSGDDLHGRGLAPWNDQGFAGVQLLNLAHLKAPIGSGVWFLPLFKKGTKMEQGSKSEMKFYMKSIDGKIMEHDEEMMMDFMVISVW